MRNCNSAYGDFGFGTFAGPDAELAKAQTALIAYFKGKGQNALPKYGADGYFGEETTQWLKKFQAEKGLPQTGVTDRATLQALGLGKSSESSSRAVATVKSSFIQSTGFKVGIAGAILALTFIILKKKRII
jgi:peptidoglycan hydrolase-like protein with peptidoglycan-binding domain